MINKPAKIIISILAALLVCAIVVFFFNKYVPVNMDELIHYYPVICRYYPNNNYNIFRESCGLYDLKLSFWDKALPLRSFPYSGSWPVAYFLPIFFIWKSYLSIRLLGVGFLLAQALIITKYFRLKSFWPVFLGIILFFPYSYQLIADTGPVGFQITALLLILLLVKVWLEKRWVLAPILIAILLFLSIWTKLVFLWYLPSIALIFLFNLLEKENRKIFAKNIRFFIWSAVLAIVVFAIPMFFLFTTTSALDGSYPYLEMLRNAGSYSLKQLLNFKFITLLPIYQSLTNPFEATQRDFAVYKDDIFSWIYNGWSYIVLPLIGFILLTLYKKWGELKYLVLYYFCFIITLFFIFRSKESWAFHHVVLVFPFLILTLVEVFKSFGINLKKITGNISKLLLVCFPVIAIFLALNLYMFYRLPQEKVQSSNDISRYRVNQILENDKLANNYFYVVVNWGYYYIQGLYGPKNQSVLYIEPLDSEFKVNILKDFEARYNRKLLFVFNGQQGFSSDALKNLNLKECKLTKGLVWRIMLENDGDPNNICLK